MPVFAVEYTYTADAAERDRVRPEHRAFLRSLLEPGSLVASGPLGAGTGALLIVVAEDADAARTLLEPDPFARAGLIAEVSVRDWSPVIGAFEHLVQPVALAPEEPAVEAWQRSTPADLLVRLGGDHLPPGRPLVIAVDGRSAGGKTTLAEQLRSAAAEALGPDAVAVLHTDDLAWHEPFFGWSHLLRAALTPLHAGEPVELVPPAWAERGRPGAIALPAGLRILIVEGVGAAQVETSELVDAAVWVQSDLAVARERGIARDVSTGVNGDLAAATAFWDEWDSHERPFLAADRPWQRARAIVWGTPVPPLPEGEFAVVDGPLR